MSYDRLTGSALRWWVWCSVAVSFATVFSVGWLEPARAWVYLWLVGRGVTRSANGDAQSLAALRRMGT